MEAFKIKQKAQNIAINIFTFSISISLFVTIFLLNETVSVQIMKRVNKISKFISFSIYYLLSIVLNVSLIYTEQF